MIPTIQSNWNDVHGRIQQACDRVGRKPDEIKVIAVTKTQPLEAIESALALGLLQLGENRVQELLDKYDKIDKKARWNLIGHLQKNKVKYIMNKVICIQSVDRVELAQEIQRQAVRQDARMPVLIQFNISKEASKFGASPDQAIPLFEAVLESMDRLRIRGLMGMAAFDPHPQNVRSQFVTLRSLFESLSARYPQLEMDTLSMGMSNDFEVAIEEGSTMVRIGSSIFGQRN